MVLITRLRASLSLLSRTGLRNIRLVGVPLVQLALRPACTYSTIFNDVLKSRNRQNNKLCTQRILDYSTEINEEFEVDSKILSDAMAENSDLYLIDVRLSEELAEDGKIPGAVNIPLHEVEYALQSSDSVFENLYGAEKPDEDTENIIFYCRGGVRSLKALAIARGLGYERTKHLAGGFMAWTDFHKKE